MANRRFGGGPNRGGGRGFPQNANVNPWQGNSGPAPVNTMGNPNLQTQLALALSSLLQPQQANDPPSLLSLNTSPRNFNQQDNYSNRIGNRGRSDFRRNEPYNKNQRGGGGWRNDRGGQNRGQISRNRPNNKQQGKDGKFKGDKKSSDKASTEASKKHDKQESQEEKGDNVDESRDEDGGDTKRDWKEEKNAGDEKGDKKDGEGDDKSKKDTSKYAGLPNSLFHCFVCNKSMWDGDSFQNHIRGKAHIQMMDSLEESFQITVKILRENMRLAEEKKLIEWNRMQRNSRKFHQRNEPESHCNMCDLKFMGKIIAHRKTEGHQRLKRFLHPNCDICNLEFPSRMEWVEHRFTPDHLFSLKKSLETNTGDDTEGHIVEDDVEWDNDPILQESLQGEDENPVLELDDDLANLYNRVPTYLPNRPVGKNSLKKLDGFFCEICKKFLRTEEDGQNHLKTEKHYHEFVSAVKDKFRANVEKDELEGNWKRKRGADESAEDKEGEEKEGDKSQEENPENGGDMYDPEEACKEDEEDAAEENAEEDSKQEEEEGDEKKAAAGDAAEEESAKGDAPAEETTAGGTEEKADVQSPSTRRRSNVRNGAGPKSKKVRKN